MQDLFAGTQPYLDLRERLFRNLNGSLQEIAANFFLSKIMPQRVAASPVSGPPVSE